MFQFEKLQALKDRFKRTSYFFLLHETIIQEYNSYYMKL